jgi:RNA polymerase-binding transcription factor DksA
MTAARYMEADASSFLKAIADAEKRLEAGTYGVCSVCGGAIVAERLRVRPYIDTCISCADKK